MMLQIKTMPSGLAEITDEKGVSVDGLCAIDVQLRPQKLAVASCEFYTQFEGRCIATISDEHLRELAASKGYVLRRKDGSKKS